MLSGSEKDLVIITTNNTDHTGGRDLLQFYWAIRSPGVWRSGADPGRIRGNPQA